VLHCGARRPQEEFPLEATKILHLADARSPYSALHSFSRDALGGFFTRRGRVLVHRPSQGGFFTREGRVLAHHKSAAGWEFSWGSQPVTLLSSSENGGAWRIGHVTDKQK
jgi:hypothetical protein